MLDRNLSFEEADAMKKFRSFMFLVVIGAALVIESTFVLAHSGGTDKCGMPLQPQNR